MQRIILMEPETPGNIGFIARLAENFAVDEYFLINPQCDPMGEEARTHAVHAQDTLEKARVVETLDQASENLDYLLGTTGITGTDENLVRTSIPPRDMTGHVPMDAHIGLLFGRESNGLSNKELDRCDAVVSIPTADDYPVLNLSHAVAIILYEFNASHSSKSASSETASSRKERAVLENLFKDITGTLDWEQGRREKAVRVFQNALGRAYLTGYELSHLLGLFREIRDHVAEDAETHPQKIS